MKNGKLVRVTAMFFALMLCFTILSRAADQMSVAVVQTERPQNRMIEHAVRASGKIEQNQELAVTTLPNQRVTAIYVREGQRVAKGDLLFEVDMTLLEEQILDQQQEMEKQELQVKDSKSQKEVSAQQKANSQAQAAEQYSLSTRQAGVQFSRAKQQLDEAKKKLKEFRDSADTGKVETSNGIGTVDSDVESALLQALEDKTNEYVAAQGELRKLEWEIENAVYTARQNAMTGAATGVLPEMSSGALSGTTRGTASANLIAEERNLTGSAEPEVLSEEDDISGIAAAEPELTSGSDHISETTAAEPELTPDADHISTIIDMEEPEIVPDTAGEDGTLTENIGTDDFDFDLDLNVEIEDDLTSAAAENDSGIVPETDDGSGNDSDFGVNDGNEDTQSSDIDIDDRNMNTGDININDMDSSDMSISNTNIENTDADDMDIDTNSTAVDLSNVDVGDINIDTMDTDNTDADDGNIADMNISSMDTGDGNFDGTDTGDGVIDEIDTGDVNIDDTDTGVQIVPDDPEQPAPQTPTPEELAQIEQTVRESYSQKLQEAQKKVSDAEEEKEAAEAALMQYQQEQLAATDSANAENAQQLAADVKAAQQAYEDAAIAANEAAVTSGRAVAIANIPDASNSSDRMNEISYEQMELTLEKLEGLEKAKGKIFAETDGLITKINIMTGEKTSDTTALLMADLAKGYRFTADITKEQQKYIGTDDPVRLTSGDGKQKLEDLPVESVAADENNEEIYHVTVQIPKDTFEIGANVTMDFSRKSETYAVTVPLSALHLDEKRQPYVLVAEEYESIMGTEQRARKMSVTVLEQNESYAALAEGVIGSEAEIIVQSDKAVDNGSRVRVAA